MEDTMPLPIARRRRPLLKLSSSPVTQVDAQGTAYLCFPEDHSWFQGTISTDDESNYSLYGERVTYITNNNEEKVRDEKKNDNEQSDNSEPETDYYRVTMIDHFSGQKYILPKIYTVPLKDLPTTSGQLFTSKHEEVTFQIENVYKGQKADIMIQRYIDPSLLGKKCLLYSGQINILFNDIAESGRSWSL